MKTLRNKYVFSRFPSNVTVMGGTNQSKPSTKPVVVQQDHTASPKAIRKEIRHLNENEWQTFVSAMWKMQISFPDPDEELSEYGIFVKMHRYQNSPAAHGGAAFLPWHREYLWR